MPRLIFSAEAGADIDEIAVFSIRTFGRDVADDYLAAWKSLASAFGSSRKWLPFTGGSGRRYDA